MNRQLIKYGFGLLRNANKGSITNHRSIIGLHGSYTGQGTASGVSSANNLFINALLFKRSFITASRSITREVKDHKSATNKVDFSRHSELLRPKIFSRNAAFWKVGTNVKIFSRMLRDTGNSKLRVRILMFLAFFLVVQLIFNVMLVILTNLYLNSFEKIPSNFGFWTSTEYRQGLVNELIKKDDNAANKSYLTTLEYIASQNNIKNDQDDGVTDLNKLGFNILTVKELNVYAARNQVDYISSYCDLLIRYALTLPTRDNANERIQLILNKSFELITHYEDVLRTEISNYKLKNKALRTFADIYRTKLDKLIEENQINESSSSPQYKRYFYFFKRKIENTNSEFSSILVNDLAEQIEDCLLHAISIVECHEYPDLPQSRAAAESPDSKITSDIAILPNDLICSELLTNSILELCLFYASTKNSTQIDKSLSILLSQLRALEYEHDALASTLDSNHIHKKESRQLTNVSEKRLMELKYESIPLIKSHVSEILWYKGLYNKAVEFAKDAAYASLMYCKENFNSAKISKMGFQNLSQMFAQMGDAEGARLCQEKADEIDVPLGAFMVQKETVRDVVLYHYFGHWGKFLFP
ncbi:unnamed protein product [[Candida] boidinii]|uniref:Unnamed protein product n=1 Tax=Candida boidinii TaxID=5477 RepID=A0A9W6WHP0_CANBO|nr:hypothetical protein B5S30_g4108 [[Candida] boidinii]OWB86209.1 hypothetical protein B5S33_g4892 [[Candida] boidinii]GME71703.1 unnamed protein product [[Candida] boidinii]GMF98913.1 unnamed protein product [[Candida] boidinii]